MIYDVRCKKYCRTKKQNICCYICKEQYTCFLSCSGEQFKTDFKTCKSKILPDIDKNLIEMKQFGLVLIMLICCIILYNIL